MEEMTKQDLIDLVQELAAEVRAYLDWQRDPNISLSPQARESVRKTMRSSLQARLQELR